MKKVIIALFTLCLPLVASAQVDALFESPKTTKESKIELKKSTGIVPEVNGKVVFSKTIDAAGKTKAELYSLVGYWAEKRYEPEATRGEWNQSNYFKNLIYSQVQVADKKAGTIQCKGAEELVFTNKFLSKNFTEIYYKALFNIEDGKVTVTISNINYVYAGSTGERFTAEEWITDKECLNKKGELRKIPGKFRTKTIAMVEQIYNEIGIIVK